MKMIKGMFMTGTTAFKGTTPEFKPNSPPMPDTVVHVMSVAKPNPEVGMTRGSVTISSKRFFPRNFFLAST